MHKRSARGSYAIDLAHPRCVGEMNSASANPHDYSVARLHYSKLALGLDSPAAVCFQRFLQAKGCSRLD